jgi:hypothetical protein
MVHSFFKWVLGCSYGLQLKECTVFKSFLPRSGCVQQSHATDNFFVIVFEYSKTTPTLRDKIAADADVIRNTPPAYVRISKKKYQERRKEY